MTSPGRALSSAVRRVPASVTVFVASGHCLVRSTVRRDRGAVRIGPVALAGLVALLGGIGGLVGCVLRLGAVGGLTVGGGGGAAEESGGAEPGSDGEHDDENAEQCDQGSGA